MDLFLFALAQLQLKSFLGVEDLRHREVRAQKKAVRNDVYVRRAILRNTKAAARVSEATLSTALRIGRLKIRQQVKALRKDGCLHAVAYGRYAITETGIAELDDATKM